MQMNAIIIVLMKAISISLVTNIILLCAYFIVFKRMPGGVDASVVKVIGFGSGFIYYSWFEQGKLFPKDSVSK